MRGTEAFKRRHEPFSLVHNSLRAERVGTGRKE